jgi:hypothetical protein
MEINLAPPHVVRSVAQRWLLNLWNRLRGPDPLPLWSDLPADDVSSLIENLLFCDVAWDGGKPRLIVRLHGARLGEVYGRKDFRGAFLDEVLPLAWRDNAMRTYEATVTQGCPIYNAVDTRDRDGRIVHLERLMLPFSRDRRTVHSVLSSIETLSAQGKFEHRDLGNSPNVAEDCLVLSAIRFDPQPAAQPVSAEVRRIGGTSA